MCISLNKGPPECTVLSDRKDGLKPIVEAGAVHQKKPQDQQAQIECHVRLSILTLSEGRMTIEKKSGLFPTSMHIATGWLE